MGTFRVLVLCSGLALPACVFAQALPAGFLRSDPIVNRALPSGVHFAHDGRVFVTEKSGLIWVYANLGDASPQVFADLRTEVFDNWDRGLLGFALDPHFPEAPYVYVQYAYNGGLFPATDANPWLPRWPGCAASDPYCGVNGGTDYCPASPGDNTNGGGCVIGGHVSRLSVGLDVVTAEKVLVEDWYQQFPSHSIGTIRFGPDGYLYAGGGDGASFSGHDFGQWGNAQYPDQRSPLNPANPNDQASNHGGSLRAQGLEIESQYTGNGHDVWLNGSIIRVDPATGEGAPGNPLANDPQPNARRIIAYGLRNPFRFTLRPGVGDVWVGDVGENTWEEINRIPALTANPTPGLQNFGWPCYEGRGHHAGFSGPICTALYSQGDTGGRTRHTQPWYAYVHSGSSDITGLAFYEGSSYPAQYQHALFFSDNSRQVIFAIPRVDANSDGVPDPPLDGAATAFYGGGNATSVQLTTAAGGDLFFANINTGKISRIAYCNGCSNLAPSAAIALAAGSSANGGPRTIAFTAANSFDPNADTLSYAWDLDGDGAFDDATGVSASAAYGVDGLHTVAVQASDGHGGVDVASMLVAIDVAPTVAIVAPVPGMQWALGDSIALHASGSDPLQGALPDGAFNWQVYLESCANPDFTGCTESSLGSHSGAVTAFDVPAAVFPAYLRIVLTGTNAAGFADSREVAVYPLTTDLSLDTDPAGLLIGYAGSPAQPAPVTRTFIRNAIANVVAPAMQDNAGVAFAFVDWSDGGAAAHAVPLSMPGAQTLVAFYSDAIFRDGFESAP